ncbi:putative transcription factor bHLH041 [Salvia hispanica]|uniref:putative transcription factor bHLH041 n=1 Tax=Salvia hispanica TaxID=49212 RepID=UPI0020092F64|nr:putative transcription factor bHLH041 [Salvia hispanica]
MESIFLLGEAQRAAFLRHTMQSFPSTTYICLWSYSLLPSSCLLFLDGFYDEEKIGNVASTRLFSAYCGSVKYVDNKWLPGLTSINNVPYMEVDVDYLLTTMLITSENAAQLQFYQVAGIKLQTVVFMGCAAGEIELGFSTKPPVNLQSEIQSRFHLHSPEQIASSSSSVDIPFISTHHSLIQTEEEQQVMTTPPSAFTRYYQPEPLIVASTHRNSNSLFARSLSFFRNLNARNSLQMHHAITERRRRQKQSHSFHILRHLVPQVSKKDNASLLSETAEYLRSMRSQLGELETRNAILEMQLSSAPREELGSSSQRVSVEMMAPSSTSRARLLDLRISLRSRECSLSDLVARVLGLLKQQGRKVSLVSLKSNTRFVESLPVHGLVLRYKVEGDEFDESGFQEAVRRVVDDTHSHICSSNHIDAIMDF